jgi:ParB family chromosome partitioning protein
MTMEKRPALGKGLSALIPDVAETVTQPRVPLDVDVDLVDPSPYQPRLHVDDTRLDELARSIAANGVIQPIVVRRTERGRFELIAGERRWRAAQRAGLVKVPVVIKETPPEGRQLLEWALIENIQREDLNPIEEATAYQRLVDEFGLTQEAVAQRVGKDRSTVANVLRLLKLPEEVRGAVASGSLSMGHARAIVAIPAEADQRRVAREVVARGLSVRDTESLVKHVLAPPKAGPPGRPAPANDADTRAAEEALRRALGVPVQIVRQGKGGRLVVAFASEDELQRLYERLTDDRR